MKDRIESLILYNLINNEDYTRKVLPFFKEEYFTESKEKFIFCAIFNFITQYNSLPSKEAILITLNNDSKIKETEYNELVDYITNELKDDVERETDAKWLLDHTEEWCKDKAIYNAILSSIKIIDGSDKKSEKGAIPKMLQDSLAVGFSTEIGHDYIGDYEKQFEFYHRVENKLPFDIEMLNKITNGGVPQKTLNIVVAATGSGKTIFGCHLAASYLSSAKKVLYITLEMARERIRERIDANLLNIPKSELSNIPKDLYYSKMAKLQEKIKGQLIIEEYPTATGHVGHFRNLLNELNLKKNFKPDVIIVDYLNICASCRVKQGTNIGMYGYVKSIAEELRGLAMEFNVPIWTFSQLNRGGFDNTDADLENISESSGTGFTADLILLLISNEDLDRLNQVMFKQLKNRYSDVFKNRRFVVGIERDYMRLHDVEQSAQENIADSGQDEDDVPAFDRSKFGDRMKKTRDFSKLKVD